MINNHIRSNFDMLRAYEVPLWRLGALAERYFAEDPNTSLLKLRSKDCLIDFSGVFQLPKSTRRTQLKSDFAWKYSQQNQPIVAEQVLRRG